MVRVPDPLPTCKAGASMTESEEDAYDRAEKHWDNYHQCEVLIKAQIYTRVPEALPIEIRKLSTAKETWDIVCAKYEHTALTVKIDIYCCMYELKCIDDSNVCMHLETMMCLQEQLVGMEAGLMAHKCPINVQILISLLLHVQYVSFIILEPL